jgi:capsular exopolysaccharide synthesis family protein
MDQFKQAINLARGAAPGAEPEPPLDHRRSVQEGKTKNVPLKAAHLEAMRIVAHNKDDLRTPSFDMLRTQILQSMDAQGWQFLAVTSPTSGCGKTVTACNIALSIARLPERSVLLVDMDMRKPKVANYLGLKRDFGLLGVLQGRQNLSEAIVHAGIEREQLLVLPGEQSKESSEWMASPTMATLLQTIKRDFRSHIIILDLPPILTGDDVLSILPQLQSVVLVAAAGSTSVSEIQESTRHLKGTPIVRVVLNKITEREPTAPYHEYYSA